MSSGTQKRAKAAVVAAAVSLDPGELVQGMVCGEYLGFDGVAVVTSDRVLFANSRTFAPEVDSIPLGSLAGVKGWIDGGRATLEISSADGSFVIGDIREVEAAQQMAGDLRQNL